MRESGLLMPLFQRLLVLAPAILADPEPTANRPRPPRSSILSLTLGPLILWERSGRRLIKLQTDIARAIVGLTKLGNAAMLAFKPILGHLGASDQTMTIRITGPKRQVPRRGAVRTLLVVAIILSIFLILLELTAGFLVDWLWFSAIGYFGVFWTTIVVEAEVFFAVFVATAIILWVNGSLAFRFSRSHWTQHPADFEWKPTGVTTVPEMLVFMRHRLPWPVVITGGAGLLAVLVAWGEVGNWGVVLRFLYQVPYGASDPLYDKDISFYLFALPAYVAIKNCMLLTLFLSALFAGAIYWVCGDIEYDAQHRSMSPTAIVHGSVLLGFFFVVKARGRGGARLRRLLRAVRRGPGTIPARVRQTKRAATGEALHPTQYRADPAGL